MSKNKIADPRKFPDASQMDPRTEQFAANTGRSYGTRLQSMVQQKIAVPGLGDVDPLTGRVEGDMREYENEILKAQTFQDNHLEIMRHQLTQMERLINAVKRLNPIMPCLVDGGLGAVFAGNTSQRGMGYLITNLESREFRFTVDGKRVPALKLIVQNNSTDTIFANFGNAANVGDFQVLSEATAYLEVVTESVWLITETTDGVVVNGNVEGVYLAAWSNPEWSAVHGQV
jgi:hypothetical protein